MKPTPAPGVACPMTSMLQSPEVPHLSVWGTADWIEVNGAPRLQFRPATMEAPGKIYYCGAMTTNDSGGAGSGGSNFLTGMYFSSSGVRKKTLNWGPVIPMFYLDPSSQWFWSAPSDSWFAAYSFFQSPLHFQSRNGYQMCEVDYACDEAFHITRLFGFAPAGVSFVQMLPDEVFNYVDDTEADQESELISNPKPDMELPVIDMHEGAILHIPIAPDCLNVGQCVIYGEGTISTEDRMWETPGDHVMGLSFKEKGVRQSIKMYVGPGGFRLYGLLTFLHTSTSNTTSDKWTIGVDVQPDHVLRIGGGELLTSVRALLKFFRPLDERPKSGFWMRRSLYCFPKKSASALSIVMCSFVGVRGSMRYYYKLCPAPGDNTEVYVTNGDRLKDTWDNMLQSGFEYCSSRISGGMCITHPYYSGESYHTPRSHVSNTVLERNLALRNLLVLNESRVKNDVAVNLLVAIGEDFSVVHFLGIPLLNKGRYTASLNFFDN